MGQCHLVHFPLIRPSRVNLMSVESLSPSSLVIFWFHSDPTAQGTVEEQHIKMLKFFCQIMDCWSFCQIASKKIRFGQLDDSKIEKLRHISGFKKKNRFRGEHGNIKGWMCKNGGSKRPTLYNLYLREKVFSFVTSWCLGVTVLHSQNAPFLEVELYEIIIPKDSRNGKGWKDWGFFGTIKKKKNNELNKWFSNVLSANWLDRIPHCYFRSSASVCSVDFVGLWRACWIC